MLLPSSIFYRGIRESSKERQERVRISVRDSSKVTTNSVSVTRAHVAKVIRSVGGRAEHRSSSKGHTWSKGQVRSRRGARGGHVSQRSRNRRLLSGRGRGRSTGRSNWRNIGELPSLVLRSGMHAGTLGVTGAMATIFSHNDSIQFNGEGWLIRDARTFRKFSSFCLDECQELGPIN